MAPLSHPQAQFVPIAPDLDIHKLVEDGSNFAYVTRISTDMLRNYSSQSIEKLVREHVILGGKPLVIEGWASVLDPELFTATWLQEQYSKKGKEISCEARQCCADANTKTVEQVRDIRNQLNTKMSIGHYLKSMDVLTKQFLDDYQDPKRQLLYLKDIDTPPEWDAYLKEVLPPFLFYLNDCVEPRIGGNGAIRELNEYGQWQFGHGVAPAGDLMSSLPVEMRAQNMMCYIGHEGTHTAAHKEMCASLGQNIMVEASKSDGISKDGSSIWFMTETKDRALVSEYFLSILGHDIELETHFAQVNAWKKAPFTVYVVEQRVGDLILIPPLASHQVWNRGTRTMKVAWNRTTVDTLERAIHEALPRGRMVCRDEQYKNKAIIYYTLLKYYNLLQRETIETKMWTYGRIKQLLEEFKRLFALYSEILISEAFSPTLPEEEVELLPYDSFVTCSYCRCNIFNRFLTCKGCALYTPEGEEEAYDVCMDCYAMGRSCACISRLNWVEQWEWHTLAFYHEQWRQVVIQYNNLCQITDVPPQPLRILRKESEKKSIAQICQEQLRLRPWHDPKKPAESIPEPSEDEGGGGKKPKRKRKGGMHAIKNKTHACHICFRQEWNWKLAFCTNCARAYCYGVLWRAFDLMPQDVMANPKWQCPRCLGICSCAACRRIPAQKPYVPKGTLLGHDTIKVADHRSVESLVDFSKTNLSWLREDGGNDPKRSNRLLRLQKRANAQKAEEAFAETPSLDELLTDEPAAQSDFGTGELGDMLAIDPLLQDDTVPSFSLAHEEYNSSMSQPALRNSSSMLTTPILVDEAHNQHSVPNPNTVSYIDDSYATDYVDQLTLDHTHVPYAPIANMYSPLDVDQDFSRHPSERGIGMGYYNQTHGVDMILYEFINMEPDPKQTVVSKPAVLADVTTTSTPPAKKRKQVDDGDEYSPDVNSGDEAGSQRDRLSSAYSLRQRDSQRKNDDVASLLETDSEHEDELTPSGDEARPKKNNPEVVLKATNHQTRSAAQSLRPSRRESGMSVNLDQGRTDTRRKRGRPRKSQSTEPGSKDGYPTRSGSSSITPRRSTRLDSRAELGTPARDSLLFKRKNGLRSRRSSDSASGRRRVAKQKPATKYHNSGRVAVELPSRRSVVQNKTKEDDISLQLGIKPPTLRPSSSIAGMGSGNSRQPSLAQPTLSIAKSAVDETFTDTGREPSIDSLFGDDDSSDGSIPAQVSR